MVPSSAQIAVWDSFKAVARRADLEIRSTMLNLEQINTIFEFHQTKGLPAPFDPVPLANEAERIYRRNERLKQTIEAVELGKLGLRFRGGDVDIMAPEGTSSDEIAPYTLGAWTLIIVGVVVASAVVLWLAALRQQNAELNGKLSALKDDADSMLCVDSSSAQCAEWKTAKESAGYERRENLIDQTEQLAQSLPNTVKKLAAGGAIGIGLAAVAVAAYLLWDKRKSR